LIKLATSTLKSLLKLRALRFLVVGIVSSASYAATMGLVVDGLGKGVVIGAIAAYSGNTFWTFSASMSGRTFWRFIVVVTLGLLLNSAIAAVLDHFKVHYLLITLVILIIVPVFNYVCHALWTYADHAAGEAK
jgi:putative flippase GtrA